MKTIKSIIEDVFRKQNLESKLRDYHVFDYWEEVVGTRVARHTRPKRFQDRILWVVVDSTVWMQQLAFLEGKIREKLNQAVGSQTVERIRFQIGELSRLPKEESESAIFPDLRKATIDDSVKRNIEKELAGVSDEELKGRLRDLFQKSSQLMRHHEKE
jgi:hypothetical protein